MKKALYFTMMVFGAFYFAGCGPAEDNTFSDVETIETTPQYIIEYNKAFNLHTQKDYTNAVFSYEQVIKIIDALKPEKKNTDEVKDIYMKSIMGAALCYGNNNNIDRSKEYFNKYQQLYPNDMDGYLKFGSILEKNSLKDEAYVQYTKAMTLDPKNATVEFALAKMHKEDGKIDEAIKFFEKGLEKDPGFQDGNGWFMLGDTYREKGDYDNQVKAYEKMVNLRPSDWQGYYYLAQAYLTKGAKYEAKNKDYQKVRFEYYQKSVDTFKKGMALKADSDSLMRGIAGAYQNLAEMSKGAEKTKYYNESVKVLIAFTEKNPENDYGFALLGEAYSKLDKSKEAIENAQKSLKIKENGNLFAYSVLGDVYYRQGAWGAAKAAYLKIVSDPNYNYAASRIEICNKRLIGEWD